MLRKSVEHQIRLAYAKVPQEAAALCAARLEVRAWLVSCGYLTVEELETLAQGDAIATASAASTSSWRALPPGLRDLRPELSLVGWDRPAG